MIMADKIIELRKKQGWTQESLAAQLGVSRQAVSKWESAQSVPDLKNLEQMSQLFEVSLDVLIKDELEISEFSAVEEAKTLNEHGMRSVSLKEIGEYLAYIEQAAPKIAFAVVLCILGCIPLIILAFLSEIPQMGINEYILNLLGIPMLFVFLIPAVVIFLVHNFKAKRFAYLKEEQIDTEYGVNGLLNERKNKLQPQFMFFVTTGVVLCMIALVLSVVGTSLAEIREPQWRILVAFSFIPVALAVYLFVSIGIRWKALNTLLQGGQQKPRNSANKQKVASFTALYYPIIAIIYLSYSLVTSDWKHSWIILWLAWPTHIVICKLIQEWGFWRAEAQQEKSETGKEN